MHQNKLFNQTRFSLAFWYSGVMAIILSLLGLGVYRAIASAHITTLDRELESVAKTLHNSLELKLSQSQQISPEVQRLLPDLCVNNLPCFKNITQNSDHNCQINPQINTKNQSHFSPHQFQLIKDGNYYLRLLDLQGCLVAFAGNPPAFINFLPQQKWQIIKENQGDRYHQVSLLLHTIEGHDWGYLQVGRSFQEFDNYLSTMRRFFILGLPIALSLIALSSWWLAGLAMQPIYQSYQQIQQFTADAAHELKTPLAAIQATIESVMRLSQLNEQEIRDVFTTLNRQNKRLTNLVQDLLLLSRLERQSITAIDEICSLNEIVTDLVEELTSLAMAANIKLTLIDKANQPLYIKGNLERLYLLFTNLIVNAIQYTPPQGRVQIILDCHHYQNLIIIKDTGIGITEKDQQHIFERFYRVNGDRSRNTGGSGLGLAIAKAITQSHHASIQVKSELGKGSIFTIRFNKIIQ